MMGVKARLISRTMSALSEEYFCAGWLTDCEYALWADLMGVPVGSEQGWGITEEDKEDLRLAHDIAGGWVIWSETTGGRVFLSDKEWLTIWLRDRWEWKL